MSVQDYIDQVRSVHPAFSRYMVPDKALADFATREQRRLIGLATQRDRSYLAQSLSILFDLVNADLDAPGTAGAGTSGGVPAEISGSSYAAIQETTGSAVTVSGGAVLVSDTVATAATPTTLSSSAATWTVNAYANDLALIVAGLGAGQAPRTIASNTATQLTVSSPWEVTPDTTSVFQVVTVVSALDGSVGVVTDLPAVSTSRGYLVKLNAQGTPYLDYTSPLVAHVSRGVPLPQLHSVLGGTVRYSAAAGASWSTPQLDYGAVPLTLVHESSRYRPFVASPAAYMQNGQLYLLGSRVEWDTVESIELRYIPVPPAFTDRRDLFLLPDSALQVLSARGALFAASRLVGLPDVPQAPSNLLASEAKDAEAGWLQTVSLATRSRIGRVRPQGR